MSDGVPPARKLRTRIVNVVGLLAGAALVYFVVTVIRIGWEVHSWHHWRPDLAEIQRWTSLPFPPSAKLLNRTGEKWLTTWVMAKIEMSRADADGFIASLPKGAKVSRTERLGLGDDLWMGAWTDKNPSWWSPDSARSFVTARVTLGRKGYAISDEAQLLVGLDDPQRAVLYLFWAAD